MTYTVDKVEFNHSKYDTLIELTFHPNWIDKFFGSVLTKRSFLGNCTVWYEIDRNKNFSRCNSSMEGLLCSIEKKEKYMLKLNTGSL
jgi:hypothetical protein